MGTFIADGTLFADRTNARAETGVTTELGATHVNTIKSALLDVRAHVSGWVNAATYGLATAASAATNGTALQDAIDAAPAGGRVLLPAGTFAYTGLVTIDKALSFVGMGQGVTILQWDGAGTYNEGSIYGQAGTAALLVTGNGVTLESFTIQGPTSAAYAASERLVVAVGASLAAPISGFKMRDVELYDSGSGGLTMVFPLRPEVVGNYIHNVGYEGIQNISGVDPRIEYNHVEDITPGTGGNMYGISLSHDSAGWPGTAATQPFTSTATVVGNIVANSAWEGISSHGGYQFTIGHNIIKNVKGTAIGAQCSSGAAANYAGGQHIVEANILYADTYANQGVGITISGGTAAYNDGIIVKGNILTGYGIANSATGGAITGVYVKGASIEGNIIRSWRGTGIYMDGPDSTFSLDGNTIVDMAAADSAGNGINIGGSVAKASIVNNNVWTGAGTQPTVGVRVHASMTNPIQFSGNDLADASYQTINGNFTGPYNEIVTGYFKTPYFTIDGADIHERLTDTDTAGLYLNYRGYNGGTTRFRKTYIGNGKAGVVATFDGSANSTALEGLLQMPEISDPSAPAANKARVYVRDNGAGKTQLVVRFPSGDVQVIATEP